MSPTARLTSIVAVAAFALGGAGLALASVGSSAADTAAAAMTPNDEATSDPAAMKALTREMARLDLRSKHLTGLLGQLRGKTQQVSLRTVTAGSTQTVSDDGDTSSPSPSSSPSTTATHSEDRDDAYDDHGDGGRNDDAYDEDDHESGDEDEDHEEHEDDEDHGGDND